MAVDRWGRTDDVEAVERIKSHRLFIVLRAPSGFASACCLRGDCCSHLRSRGLNASDVVAWGPLHAETGLLIEGRLCIRQSAGT